MTLTIDDVVRLERLIREAKGNGASSKMTIHISEVQRLVDFAKQTLGEDKVEEKKAAENVVQYKPEVLRTRTFRSWQDDLERQRREEATKRKTLAKRRRERQQRNLTIVSRTLAISDGNPLKKTA